MGERERGERGWHPDRCRQQIPNLLCKTGRLPAAFRWDRALSSASTAAWRREEPAFRYVNQSVSRSRAGVTVGWMLDGTQEGGTASQGDAQADSEHMLTPRGPSRFNELSC